MVKAKLSVVSFTKSQSEKKIKGVIMVDKVSIPKINENITGLYALKKFVASQQLILEGDLVKEYASVLEDYIKKHEDYIGGWSYSIWKKLSRHPKFEEPTLRINLRKGNFNDYWLTLFNKSIKKTMPEWTDFLIGDIDVVYSDLNEIKKRNSTFLENFEDINIAAEAGISKNLKEMENYLVNEALYLKYKEHISLALDKYNESVLALVKRMNEIGVSYESIDGVDLKGSIAESNKVLGVIGDSEDRKTVLQGAFLLRDSLNEVQKAVNVCLTDISDDCKFYDQYLVTLDAGSFMGMLCQLKNTYLNGHEFKARAFESLGYTIEGTDSVNPYASTLVAVRDNKK